MGVFCTQLHQPNLVWQMPNPLSYPSFDSLYFSSLCSSNYWKYTILIIKKHDILHITKTSLCGGIKTKLIVHWLREREGNLEWKRIPENIRINLNNKETRSMSLILDPRVNMFGNWTYTVQLAKITNRRFGVLSAQSCITFIFSVLSECASLYRILCTCVCVCLCVH